MATVISMDTELGHSPRYGEQRLLPSAFPCHNLNWSPLFLTVDVLLPIHAIKMKPNDTRNSSDNHLVRVVCGGFYVNICFLCFMTVNRMGLGLRWLVRQNKTFNNIILCFVEFCFIIAAFKKQERWDWSHIINITGYENVYNVLKAWLYPSTHGLTYETECIYSHLKCYCHFKRPCRGEKNVDANVWNC